MTSQNLMNSNSSSYPTTYSHVAGTEAYPVEYKSHYTIRTVESEQEIQKKSGQLKKLARAFYVLQQDKKRVDEYCLTLESQNVQLKEEIQQQKMMMDAKDKKIARQHEKLLEKEEGYLEKLEDQVADLTIQRDTHWLPQLKHNQRQKNLLEKKNIILRNQLKEVRAELTSMKSKLQETLDCTDKDTLMAQIKSLEKDNTFLHKDVRESRRKLVEKTDLCKQQSQIIQDLTEENTKLKVDLSNKKIWNNQTQLYFSEKREMVGQLKRETGVLRRQLRRETKRGLKRETVLHTLINENRETRHAHELQYLKPVTVVEHCTDEVFYNSVKNQLSDIVRELELEKPSCQVTAEEPIASSVSTNSPSVSSISSTDHIEQLRADINRLNRSTRNEQMQLRQTNSEQVGKFVLFHEELSPSVTQNSERQKSPASSL